MYRQGSYPSPRHCAANRERTPEKMDLLYARRVITPPCHSGLDSRGGHQPRRRHWRLASKCKPSYLCDTRTRSMPTESGLWVRWSAAALPALQQDSRAAAPTAAAIGDTSWRRTVFTSALAVVRASHAGLAEASRAPGHGLSHQ